MNHMQRYLAEEFAEDYHAGRISRRQALQLIASFTGSMLLANSFLAACAPPPAAATAGAATTPTSGVATSGAATSAPTNVPASAIPSLPAVTPLPTAHSPLPTSPAAPYGTVVPDDPAVSAGPVTFPGSSATLMGYQAHPTGVAAGSFPVVLVCHENRGLTAHIQDVARRFAKAGYGALAVGFVSPEGRSARGGEGGAPGALGAIGPDQFVQDFANGRDYMQGQAFASVDHLGMVGFCFGGGVTWLVAEGLPQLKAAVPFYGPPPPVDKVPNIQAAVLALYGVFYNDTATTEPAMEAAMQQAGKVFDKMIYPGAGHAFFNDTGANFNLAAAQGAWARTLAWFEKYL